MRSGSGQEHSLPLTRKLTKQNICSKGLLFKPFHDQGGWHNIQQTMQSRETGHDGPTTPLLVVLTM